MSKIALTPSATGTGVFTISSPATNTNRTLTLPDEAGTVLTSASTANFPAGSVLQVINAKYNTATSTTSGTPFDSGLTASITPSNTSNKILVLVSSNGVQLPSNSFGKVTLTDGSNNVLTIILTPVGYTNSGDDSVDSVSTCFHHSPESTSTQTYKVRGELLGGTQMIFQTSTGGNSESTITLMEIAG
jgi:hypothetical protein